VKNKEFPLVPSSNGHIGAILFSAYDEIFGKIKKPKGINKKFLNRISFAPI
jgi:hypothetical protein